MSTLFDVRSMMRATTIQTTRATHRWTSTRRAKIPRTRTRAFVPPLVPNPDADDSHRETNADAAPTLPNIARALESHGWAIGTERGYDDDPHAFKIYRVRDGRRAMEALRDALRKEEERGCRIRRETQTVYSVCCAGVRSRLNEGKGEVVVEMACDSEDSVGGFVEKARVIEEAMKRGSGRRST